MPSKTKTHPTATNPVIKALVKGRKFQAASGSDYGRLVTGKGKAFAQLAARGKGEAAYAILENVRGVTPKGFAAVGKPERGRFKITVDDVPAVDKLLTEAAKGVETINRTHAARVGQLKTTKGKARKATTAAAK